MNCIIIDDEPLAREAMDMLVEENKELRLLDRFNNAASAARSSSSPPPTPSMRWTATRWMR